MTESCFKKMALGWFNSNAKETATAFSAIDTEILENKNLYICDSIMINRSFCRCIIPEDKRRNNQAQYLYFRSIDFVKLDSDGDISDVVGIDYEFLEV